MHHYIKDNRNRVLAVRRCASCCSSKHLKGSVFLVCVLEWFRNCACTLQQGDGTTSELFDDLLSALLEDCYPSPGKTPRYRNHRDSPRFHDANEKNPRNDGNGSEGDELSEEASSPRVALPASARKLARALSSAGVPANEAQATKMRQRTNSSDGFSSSQGDDDILDGFTNDGDSEACSQDTRLQAQPPQRPISGASPGGASLNYLLQVTE